MLPWKQRTYQFCRAGTGTLYGREMRGLRCEALSPTCSFHSSFSLCYHMRKKSLMESCGLDQLHPGIGFPGGSVLMNLPANAGDAGSIPGSRRSPEGGNNNPLQYSCLGNPIDSGAWRATVHRIAKSQTRLSDYAHTNTHTLASRWHLWSQTPSGTDYGARRGSFSILTSS